MKGVSGQIGTIPERSMMYLVLCLVILIILYLAVLYPSQRSMKATDARTLRVTALIEKQQALQPLYKEMAKRSENITRGTLPVPEIKPLPRGAIDLISPLFQTVAEGSGMQILSIKPNLQSVTGESEDMVVTIHLRGQFLDFRKFLLRAGAVPSLRGLEEIQISQEGEHKDFHITVRLAIE